MNIVNTLTEKLPLFINELRCIGYNISTAQYIAVQNLILALAKQGKLPPKLAQLNTLFAPILCHSQKEQQAFGSHFNEWVQRIEKDEEIPYPDENAISDTLPQKKIRSTKKWVIITTVIVIAMLIGSFVFYQFFPKVQETPPTETTDISEPQTPSPEPVLPEPETIPKSPEPQTYFWWMFLVLPLILLLRYLWQLFWRHFWRRYLVRKYTSIQPDIKKLSVETAEVEGNIFQPFELSQVAQQLRKHISVESIHLDVTATIEKSIEAGNWFTPVRGTMKRRPEYLVLIDRLTFKDHQTQLVDTLVNQLIKEEVSVNRYYFDATPRRCYPEDTRLAPLTLIELAAHYPTHKLLIFSDGNGFINPITGKIVDWINQLSIWTHRTLFTLEAPDQWGYREHLLKEEADFLIMPANEAGLKFLVEQMNGNARQSYHSPLWQNGRKNLAFPEVLNENFNRWLERHAPDAEVLTELLTQVKLFLGKKAYYWFCACAVYPELHWQLTLYLKKELLTESELLEDFMKLARLPWFRYGYMPDWLREPLVEELTAQQKDKEVHATLEKLLKTIGLDKNSEAFLKIAIEQQKRLNKHNPLKEHVFLKFMADKKLAVKAPERLRHLLGGSFKLPTISKKTVWKVTTVILLITLIFGALEIKDYIKEQQRLAEQALEEKLQAERERLAKEKAKIKAEQERLAKKEEAKRRAAELARLEAEAQRQAELQKKQEIVSLLQDCEKHLKANRLTTGRGGTAFDCYRTVLKREPDSKQAKEGLVKIEKRYQELIAKAQKDNQPDKVGNYLERLREVNPESNIYAEIEKHYVDLIKKAWQENKSDEVDAYLLLVGAINPKSEIFAEIESLRQTEEQRLAQEAEEKRKAEEQRLAQEAEEKRKAEKLRLAEEYEVKRKAEQQLLLSNALSASQNVRLSNALSASQNVRCERGIPIALLIANGKYINGTIRQPINDALAIKKVLEEIGFRVIFKTELNQRAMYEAIIEFSECLKISKGVGLFYFSGYGMQLRRKNYLLPININIRVEADVKYDAFRVDRMFDILKRAENELNIIILDASRENPFPKVGKKSGLASVSFRGALIAYPTEAGKTIQNNRSKNSLYISTLTNALKNVVQNHKRIEDVFMEVANQVDTKSRGGQIPTYKSSLKKKFCFGGC